MPGLVRGQARTGGSETGRRFKTPETKLYENRVAEVAAVIMRGHPLFDGPLSLTLVARMMIPDSRSKKWKADAAAGRAYPTVKPDWDNIAKITDAMTGIVWKDDKQIVFGSVAKQYAAVPGLYVIVKEILP